MNEKNVESDQKIITKIKHIKNLSPFSRDLSLKQRKSNESTEQNNNKQHGTYSPFNRNQKNNISTEKETFLQRSSNRSRDKDNTFVRKSPINKSKHLTYINNYKKKNINENNNYGVLENNKNMEEIEKKKKLYENQREVPFFRKYIDKIRENGLAESQTSGNRPSVGKNNYNNYSYRENTRNRDKIRDLIENINNKNNRSNRIRRYNEEKEENPIIENYTSKNSNDKYYKREIKRDSKNIINNDNKDIIIKDVDKDISYRENDKKDKDKDRKVYQNEYVKSNEKKEVIEIEDNKGNNNIFENKEDKKECLDNDKDNGNGNDKVKKEDINNMEKEEEKIDELKNNDEKEKNEEKIHFENNDENKYDIISMKNIKTEDTNDNNNDKDKDNTTNLEVDKKEDQQQDQEKEKLKAEEVEAQAKKDNNIINDNDNNMKEEEAQNLDKKEDIAKEEIKKEEVHENKNEQIMDENEEKKLENENNSEKIKNEEEKKEEDDKDKYEIKKSFSNSQMIVKYENDSIKIDNSSKINITLNEPSHPKHDLSKEKKTYPKNVKNIKQIKLIKNKNNSVEVRKKKLHMAHINSHTEDKNFYTSPIKTAENNYNSSELNNEVISAKNLSKNLSNNNNVINKKKIPKLNINSKSNNRDNNSSDRRSNNGDNVCMLCKKKNKKFLMCPKCHKVCCEKCIKNKKKKNKFCSFCNYFINDITKYIILNTNRNSIQKNKSLKNEENSPHKISGHSRRYMKANIYSQPKNKMPPEETPSFRRRNDSEKRNEKSKKVIKHRFSGEKNSHSQKNENEEDENKNIRRTYDNRKTEELFKTKKFYETYIDGHKSKTHNQISLNNKSKGEDIEDFDPNDKKENNNNKLRSSKPTNTKDKNEENKKADENNLNSIVNKNDKAIDDDNKGANENLNDKNNNDNIKYKEEINKDICLEHNNKLSIFCIQCNKELCDECINNHMNNHNLIKYSNIDYDKFKNLLTQKNENDNKNTTLQNHLNDFTQKIKSYKLEKDIIISEINKIINNYINSIDLKIQEINEMMEKIKNEQNKIIENNNIINDQLALFYKLNLKETDKVINNEESLNDDTMNKIAKIGDLDYYSNEIQKINDNKDYLKFNYFTSQIMKDIPLSNSNNTILFSKLYFNEENFNDFIYNLKYNNKNNKNNTNNNNSNNNPYGIDLDELKEFIFKDESNINSDLFIIRNWKNKALIQINIDLNMNSENEDNDIFYNNINCFLLISNKDLNNYCELNQKLFSKGNLCLYVIIPWEQFNIFNYEHLCFKVIIFNHNK